MSATAPALRGLLLALALWCSAAPAAAAAAALPPAPEVPAARCEDAGPAGAGSRASRVVHGAATLAALADGSLAQIPGTGPLLIPTIQAAMVYAIGHLYGCHLDRSHALTVVTYLASNHVKKAFLKEMIGFIPLAGNVIKASVTFFMTEGIGNMAEKMLRCAKGGDELIEKALESEGVRVETKYPMERASHLFHFVSDYLINIDLTSLNAEEAWQRAKQLLSMQDQGQLLAAVRHATTAEELAQLVQQHVWNLEIVEAALAALEEGFPHQEACIVTNFVASKLWTPTGVDADARAGVSRYLLHCLEFASPGVQASTAHAAVGLIAGTGHGTRGGIPPRLLEQALEMLEHLASQRPTTGPALDGADLPPALTAVFAALVHGEARACGALRALLSLESWASAVGSPGAPSGRTWAAVHHLQQLEMLRPPPGTELCLPALAADLRARLRVEAVPEGVELPRTAGGGRPQADGGGEAARPRGGLGRLGRVLEEVVGQRCAINRLIGHPGLARLKYRGMWRPDMPLVLLLTGPSGTGKTMLARLLAEVFLNQPMSKLESDGRFRTFHMNYFSLVEDQKSFFGPPKGIAGSGDLPELLKAWPDAVILLDEVEKAHPSFARALLKVFGENGAVYDPRTGRDIPTSNATFILTSNLGKDFIAAQSAAAVAEEDPDCTGYENLRNEVLAMLREPHIDGRQNFFRESELRGRLTDVLPFVPFSAREVEAAVRSFLTTEARAFEGSPEFAHAALTWEPRVVTALASEYARRPEEGLRGVQVQLQARVREVLEAAVAAGLLEPAAQAVLLAPPMEAGAAGRLDLRVVPADGAGGAGTPPAPAASPGREGRLPPGAVGAGGGAGFPGAGASAADSGAWGSAIRWEHVRAWDWELAWRQIWEFLWEWRLPVLIFAAMVFVATSAAFAPAVSPGVSAMASSSMAAASPTAAPAVAAAGAAVATWAPGFVAMVQLAAGAGSVAVPVLTAAYAWRSRHEIAALAWSGFALLFLPAAVRFMYRQWTVSVPRGRDKCVPRCRLQGVRGSPRKQDASQAGKARRRRLPASSRVNETWDGQRVAVAAEPLPASAPCTVLRCCGVEEVQAQPREGIRSAEVCEQKPSRVVSDDDSRELEQAIKTPVEEWDTDTAEGQGPAFGSLAN